MRGVRGESGIIQLSVSTVQLFALFSVRVSLGHACIYFPFCVDDGVGQPNSSKREGPGAGACVRQVDGHVGSRE